MDDHYYSKSAEELTTEFDTSLEVGLSSAEAKKRFESHGPNALVEPPKDSMLKRFLLQFHDFMVYLLIGAAIVSALFGDYLEAGIIAIIIVLNGVLGFYQEYRAEQSLEKLKELTGDDTLVIRDGKETRIDTRDLVVGDVLLMYEGETIGADARVFSASRLRVEEGLLTGESVPVEKNANVVAEGEYISLPEQTNMAFMGTTTVNGRGKALVVGTGMKTEMGKIAQSTLETEEQKTPLQMQLSRLGLFIGLFVVVITVVVILAQLFKDNGVSTKEIVETAIALAVSAVPEGLAAAVTLTLALGVQRMSRKRAIAKKLPAVETLGSVEVICTDKTGTLTQNKMTVQRIWTAALDTVNVTGIGYSPDGQFENPSDGSVLDVKDHADLEAVLRCGALCNTATVFHSEKKKTWVCEGDPTEGSLVVSARKSGLLQLWDEGYELKKDGEIFFESVRKRMSMVVSTVGEKKPQTWAFTKGSPNRVLEICTSIQIGEKVVPLDEEMRSKIAEKNKELASHAFRILGFAKRAVDNDLTEFTVENVEQDMIFLGLQGMIDPPRPEVADAVARCKNAGIRIIMITGDQFDTAMAIAKNLDLKPYEDEVYTAYNASDLERMDDEQFKEVVADLDVCARASPGIKQRIVACLQDDFNHVVAMTGDGVNDAPALKKADIGVAMGIAGTDVAREASDMVLTDDNFATIVDAVEEGRVIYENMKKFIRYLLSSNFDEILVVFVATVLFAWPSPYLALGILWINLLTDGLPALALSVDPGDPGIMDKKPRGRGGQMLNHILVFAAIAGVISFMATMIVFHEYFGTDLETARTMALTVSVLFELFQVFISKSEDGKSVLKSDIFNNVFLLIAVGTAFVLHLAIIYVGFLASAFHLVPLDWGQWAFMLIIVIPGIALLDIAKLWHWKHSQRNIEAEVAA